MMEIVEILVGQRWLGRCIDTFSEMSGRFLPRGRAGLGVPRLTSLPPQRVQGRNGAIIGVAARLSLNISFVVLRIYTY